MTFYNEKEQLYLETDMSDFGLGASLEQEREGLWFPRNEAPGSAVLEPIAFVKRSISSAETCYNIEREALGILNGLDVTTTVLAMKGSVIRDHRPLAVIFKKDIASLSHRLQRILSHIH